MLLGLEKIHRRLSPFARGSLFYGAYWGVAAVFNPFLFVYFAELGLGGAQIGLLFSILSLCFLIAAPLVSRLADTTNRRADILALCLAAAAARTAAQENARGSAVLPVSKSRFSRYTVQIFTIMKTILFGKETSGMKTAIMTTTAKAATTKIKSKHGTGKESLK